MKFRRVLPAPAWSLRRWSGAAALSFLLPPAIAATLIWLGHFPIGGSLPRSVLWTEFGPALLILAIVVVVLVAAPLYSLLAWSWCPILLAIMLLAGGFFGLVPGSLIGDHMKEWAFKSFSSRSAQVVRAITNYVSATGKPPPTLKKLVPDYLPTMPSTGMAAGPEYHYEPGPGPCSLANTWHMVVPVQDFLTVHWLLYCPAQDYALTEASHRLLGDWLYELID
jgi:hypothetical protein